MAGGRPGGARSVCNRGIGRVAERIEPGEDIAHQRVFASEQMGAAGDVEPDRAGTAKRRAAGVFVRRRPRGEPAAPVAEPGQCAVLGVEIGFAGLQVRQDRAGIGEGHTRADTGLFGDRIDRVEDQLAAGLIDQCKRTIQPVLPQTAQPVGRKFR